MYVFIIEAVELSDEPRTHLSAYRIMISFCRQKVREYSDEYIDGSNTMPMSFMFFSISYFFVSPTRGNHANPPKLFWTDLGSKREKGI